MYERMLNKQETPTIEEMIKFCGENSERFSLLNEWLTSAFNTEQKVVFPYGNKYGWGVAHKKKNKLSGWIHYRVTSKEHFDDIKILLSVKCL